MDLIRDCLDKQLVDARGRPMGRVDGIVVEWSAGQQPQVTDIEVGAVIQWRRVHPRLGRLAASVRKWFGVAKEDPYRIAWSKLVSTGNEVIANVEAQKTPALAWERWLRKKIIMKIPGA